MIRMREEKPKHVKSSARASPRQGRAHMDVPIFDRGETADITISFDGSVQLAPGPDGYSPGPGGYGGVVNINGRVYHVTGRLGDTTKEISEYMGLIACMRGVIRTLQTQGWRHYYSSLYCLGDSDVVIDQLKGKCDVNHPRLKVLYDIVRSLQREFNFVSFSKIGRHENIQAHQLANKGRKSFSRPAIAVYHPNLTGMCDVWIEGCRTLASNDIETTGKDPSFMIDSRYLRSLPGGRALMRNMQDPYPLSMVRGKVNMTVLGTVQLHVGVRSFGTPLECTPPCGPDTEGLSSFVVVEELPCPVHVSWKNSTFPMNTQSSELLQKVPFTPDEIPAMYGSHKYWNTDVRFIGMEV